MNSQRNPFEAYADAYAALIQATPQCRVVPIGRPGSLVCTVTPFPLSSFNRAMRVRLTEPEAADAVDAVTAAHATAGVPGSWWLDPGSTPPEVEQHLERRGYRLADRAPTMVMDLGDVPEIQVPRGATVTFVRGREQMREAQLVIGRGFGRPAAVVQQMANTIAAIGDQEDSPIRVVVATHVGVPVAAATGITAGDVCGVFNVATLPEARGTGLGRAMTLAILHDAVRRGARMATLHASELGFGIYQRIGFRHVGDFRRFTVPR